MRDQASQAPLPGAVGTASEAIAAFGRLAAGELHLARAEIAQGLTESGRALARIVVGCVIGLVGLMTIAGGAVAALIEAGLRPSLASLVVGGTLCLVAGVLAQSGRSALRLRALVPERALRGLRRDAEAVRAGLKLAGERDDHVGNS